MNRNNNGEMRWVLRRIQGEKGREKRVAVGGCWGGGDAGSGGGAAIEASLKNTKGGDKLVELKKGWILEWY